MTAPFFALSNAVVGDTFRVKKVTYPVHAPEWAGQLEDIGFLPGEEVAIMARAWPDGDPLVVRVGLSTFALRAAEASCIEVVPMHAA